MKTQQTLSPNIRKQDGAQLEALTFLLHGVGKYYRHYQKSGHQSTDQVKYNGDLPVKYTPGNIVA